MCNFCCTFDMLPHSSNGAPSNLRSHPAGHTAISGTFLQKGCALYFAVMRASLCKHKRPHSRQNIELTLYFCKKGFENLRMCNFCCTFAG